MVMEQRDIVIITDFEEGHFYPLFSLARDFEKAGYSICFVGILDTAEIITKNGFECIPIFQNIFPKGYVKNHKNDSSRNALISTGIYFESIFDEFDRFMPFVKPKLIFLNYFFSLGALLIHYKYGIKQVIYHTLLPELSGKRGISLGQLSANNALSDFMELPSRVMDFIVAFFEKENLMLRKVENMIAPLKKMPQVMLCPLELEIIRPEPSPNEIYLGPCIYSFSNLQSGFLQDVLKKNGNKKLIYVSMGSQTRVYPKKAEIFFNIVLETMKLECMKDFHLVLSVGSNIENWNLVELPKNANVYSWVPQIEVLQLASMAIIHGGLGSTKECILFGTPMLVVPMGRDQMDNAKRVEHHKIGYSLNFDMVTEETISKKLIELYKNKKRKENLAQMQHVFQEKENHKYAVRLVKNLI